MLAVFLCLRKLSWFFQKNRVVKPVSKYPYAEQGINSNKAQIKKGFNKTQTKNNVSNDPYHPFRSFHYPKMRLDAKIIIRGFDMLIKRDRYLNKLISKKWNGMIKVITGIRRCGKSYLLFELFKQHLIDNGVEENQIIEISLDSVEFEDLQDKKKLNQYIQSKIRSDKNYYVLLDEIQLVDGFELLLNGLLKQKNIDVYVTGSNSKFLSSDIITEFRGRGDEVSCGPHVKDTFKKGLIIEKREVRR